MRVLRNLPDSKPVLTKDSLMEASSASSMPPPCCREKHGQGKGTGAQGPGFLTELPPCREITQRLKMSVSPA